MKILINNEISIEKWKELLALSQFTSVFQTPEFYNLFNSVPGFCAEAFAVENTSEIRALCVVTLQKETGIKGYFSRRAIIYGGPVLKGKSENELVFLLNNITTHFQKKAIYVEVRNYFDYSSYTSQYMAAGWSFFSYLNIILPLRNRSLESVFASMKYNRKREIKLSLAEGAYYREAQNLNEVENLFLILNELYKQKVKLPLPRLEFFNYLFSSSLGKVFVVLKNEKIIGGSFCLFLENKALYTMYYCGIRNYHKKIFPTHLSILAAINFGIQNKVEYLDFMGAGLKGKEYGVRDYKLQFGGSLVYSGRFKKVINPLLYYFGLLWLKILKKIK